MKTIFDFIAENGRTPFVSDNIKPWSYRGWNLPYLMMAEQHPDVCPRYSYLLEIFETGKLPDRPIPRISFGKPDKTVESMINQCTRIIARDAGGWSDFRIFVEWLAWSLAVRNEPPSEISEENNEKLYRLFSLGPWLLHPHDYLGAWIATRQASGWNPNAFYPTPHQVVELITEMNHHDDNGQDTRLQSVMDPCVGTGRMLLHASNYSLNLYGCDIDPFVVQVTKINGALYAPWIAFPLPDHLIPTPAPAQHLNAQPDQDQADREPSYTRDAKGQLRLF